MVLAIKRQLHRPRLLRRTAENFLRPGQGWGRACPRVPCTGRRGRVPFLCNGTGMLLLPGGALPPMAGHNAPSLLHAARCAHCTVHTAHAAHAAWFMLHALHTFALPGLWQRGHRELIAESTACCFTLGGLITSCKRWALTGLCGHLHVALSYSLAPVQLEAIASERVGGFGHSPKLLPRQTCPEQCAVPGTGKKKNNRGCASP